MHPHLDQQLEEAWNPQDLPGSRGRLRNILDAQSSGDPCPRAEILSQIARTHSIACEFDQAHSYLDEADGLLPPGPTSARVRCLLERGRTWNSAGEKPRAEALFRQAWDLARAGGWDFLAVDAAHMMAIAEMGTDQELAWNRKALEAIDASPDARTRKWLGPVLNNLGWGYHDRGRYLEALEILRRALELRKHEGEERSIRIARYAVARVLRSLGRLDDALEEQRALKALFDADGEVDGFVEEEIAECLLARGQASQARGHFAAAHAALSADPWLRENEPRRLERLRTLAAL